MGGGRLVRLDVDAGAGQGRVARMYPTPHLPPPLTTHNSREQERRIRVVSTCLARRDVDAGARAETQARMYLLLYLPSSAEDSQVGGRRSDLVRIPSALHVDTGARAEGWRPSRGVGAVGLGLGRMTSLYIGGLGADAHTTFYVCASVRISDPPLTIRRW